MKIFDPQRSKQGSRYKLFICLTAVIAGWYVFLCLVHLLSGRPLWNDEQCVFRSVEAYGVREMFTRDLINGQVFPRVYLLGVQMFARLFDLSLVSLRFFSFAAMMSAFALWLRLAAREFQSRPGYLTFVLSWPASALLIYYSAELKPYSMDVLAGAVFFAFLSRQGAAEFKRKTLWLVLLPALGLFSYPAYLFAMIVLYNLALEWWRRRRPGHQVLIYAASLAVFLSISYFFDMRLRHIPYVTGGFSDYFISFNSVGDFFKTFQEGTLALFTKWLVIRPRIIKKISTFFLVFGLLYMFYGFFKIFKKEKGALRSWTAVAFALFFELFILGLFKKYPYTVPRTSLFFCPFALGLTVKGILHLKGINRHLYRIVHGGYLAFLVFLMLALTRIVCSGKMNFIPVIFKAVS